MEKNILQYQIDCWEDLSKCKSNTCPELSISVSKYLHNYDIEGIKISVNHPKYGTLFAYTINPKGMLVAPGAVSGRPEMTHDILFTEIARYGFYVSFTEYIHLSWDQVKFLRTIQGLGFDKIRLLPVYDNRTNRPIDSIGVAFKIDSNEAWINPGYAASEQEFEKAVISGTALNLSKLPGFEKNSWDWMYNAIFDIDYLLMRYDNESK